MPESVVVIGVGNALAYDDAAGLEVVRRLRVRAEATGVAVVEQEGAPLALLEQWDGLDAVVLVDAVRSGAAPGSIHHFDASCAPLPARLRGASSTHALGVGEAIDLARTLGRLPARVLFLGIEAARFDAGMGLSAEVEAALTGLADVALREACALHDARIPREACASRDALAAPAAHGDLLTRGARARC